MRGRCRRRRSRRCWRSRRRSLLRLKCYTWSPWRRLRRRSTNSLGRKQDGTRPTPDGADRPSVRCTCVQVIQQQQQQNNNNTLLLLSFFSLFLLLRPYVCTCVDLTATAAVGSQPAPALSLSLSPSTFMSVFLQIPSPLSLSLSLISRAFPTTVQASSTS